LLTPPQDFHHPDDGGASTSEMSVNFYQTTQCNNPEDSHLQATVSFLFLNNLK
jgi:hypothetical protein